MTIVAVFATLVALMLVGLPIAIAMALTGALIMLSMGGPDMLVMLAQRMYSSTTSFPLLAIPFFILAGNLMNTGGMTQRIFDFTQLLVGRVRGGLAHANMLASMIFAGMSGSAVADAAGLGAIEINAMKKEGYSTRFAAALTCASCTIGPIIPPSIPFVIYGIWPSLDRRAVPGRRRAGIPDGRRHDGGDRAARHAPQPAAQPCRATPREVARRRRRRTAGDYDAGHHHRRHPLGAFTPTEAAGSPHCTR